MNDFPDSPDPEVEIPTEGGAGDLASRTAKKDRPEIVYLSASPDVKRETAVGRSTRPCAMYRLEWLPV